MAGSATVGILRALLTTNAAEFSAGMRQAADAAEQFAKQTKAIGQQATQIGTQLTKTLTLPILAMGAGSAKAAIDFQSSFAGIGKTVEGIADQFGQLTPEGAKLAQSFRDLAKEIPVNVNELNRLGEAAGAFGIPKQSILEFSRVMAELGVTTNLTSDQAAESIAKIQNIYGAAGQDTERFASTLVALGNSGASTETQIVEMAKRIAGAGNIIGLTQGETLAFATALADVGIEAEAGGSAISRVFVDIASAVNTGGVAVSGFAQVAGMSSKDFSKAFKDDAAGAMSAFVEGLGRVKDSGGDLFGTLENLGFSEIRTRDALLRLAGAGDGLKKSLDIQATAWRENTALSDEAQKRFGTVESKLTLLWGRIRDVGITIGNALLPAIQSAIGMMNTLIPVIERVAQFFAAMPPGLQLTVIAFAGLVAAIGPAIFVIGQLVLSGSAIAGAFGTAGIATMAMGAFGNSTVIITARLWLMEAASKASAVSMRAFGVTLAGIAWPIAALAAIAGSLALIYRQADNNKVLAASLVKVAGGVDDVVDAQEEFIKQQVRLGRIVPEATRTVNDAKGAFDRFDLAGGDAAAVLSTKFIPAAAGVVKPTSDAANAAKALAEAIRGMVADMTGLKVLADATTLEAAYRTALEQTHGQLILTREQKDKYVETIQAVIDKYGLMGPAGAAVVEHFKALKKDIDPALTSTRNFRDVIDTMPASTAPTTANITGMMNAFKGLNENGTLPATQKFKDLIVTLPDIRNGITTVSRPTVQLDADLKGLSQALANLAQVTGGALGAIAQMVSGMSAGYDGVKVFKGGIVDLFDVTRAYNDQGELVPKTFGNYAAGATKAAAGLMTMISAMQAATSHATKLENAISGGLAGAQVGGQLGGAWGALIGGIGGFLWGLGDTTQRVTQKMIADFIAAAGGLEELRRRAAEAGVSLDNVIPKEGEWFQAIANTKEWAAEIARVNKALQEHADKMRLLDEAAASLAGGFNAVALTMTAGYDAIPARIAAAQTAVEAAQAAFLALHVEGKGQTLEWHAAVKNLAYAEGELAAALENQRAVAAKVRQELVDVGFQALLAFNAAIARGDDYFSALGSIGAGLDVLIKAHKDLGIEIDDAALQQLILSRQMMTNNPALIAGVSGLAQEFKALDALGMLNSDTFAAMQRTGSAMYLKLQAEAAALGGGTREALLPMQGYLHEAEKAAKELGIPLDDNTQMLIDQSKELLIWKEAGKSSTELMIEATKTLNTTMEKLVEILSKGLPAAAASGAVATKAAISGVTGSVDTLGAHISNLPWEEAAARGTDAFRRAKDAIDDTTEGSGVVGLRDELALLKQDFFRMDVERQVYGWKEAIDEVGDSFTGVRTGGVDPLIASMKVLTGGVEGFWKAVQTGGGEGFWLDPSKVKTGGGEVFPVAPGPSGPSAAALNMAAAQESLGRWMLELEGALRNAAAAGRTIDSAYGNYAGLMSTIESLRSGILAAGGTLPALPAGLPTFADGGFVMSPMLSIVGDVPEMIIPLDRMGELMDHGGSSMDIRALKQEMASFKDTLNRNLRHELPLILESASRHGQQTAGRRR